MKNMSKSRAKHEKAVAMDVVAVIYQATLQVRSKYVTAGEGANKQEVQSRALVAKHGIAATLKGIHAAFSLLGSVENGGRVPVKVGEGEKSETFMLKPFIEGLDRYMYARWPDQIEEIKCQVVDEQQHDIMWGREFLNHPYVAIDLSQMPEEEEEEGQDEKIPNGES